MKKSNAILVVEFFVSTTPGRTRNWHACRIFSFLNLSLIFFPRPHPYRQKSFGGFRSASILLLPHAGTWHDIYTLETKGLPVQVAPNPRSFHVSWCSISQPLPGHASIYDTPQFLQRENQFPKITFELQKMNSLKKTIHNTFNYRSETTV